MIRIAICSDNEVAFLETKENLKKALSHFGTEFKAEMFGDIKTLLSAMHERFFEFVICESFLQQDDMVQFAQKIREGKYPVHFIFITKDIAQTQKVLEIFPLAVFDKIPSEEKLLQLFEFVLSFRHTKGKFYVSAKNGEKQMIETKTIKYIEVFHNDICIHLSDGREVVCRHTLTGFLKKLGGNFVRCHQSYAVNVESVVTVKRYSLTLDNGKTVPVSKNSYCFVREIITRRHLTEKK